MNDNTPNIDTDTLSGSVNTDSASGVANKGIDTVPGGSDLSNQVKSNSSSGMDAFGSTPDDSGNQSAEAKRKRGLGDKNYISYYIPWILYFFPNPKTDPNYILLNPEQDTILVNKKKTQFLTLISVLTFFGILYAFWKAGALFPALHTMWFFLWRYFTLIAFFFFFSVVIAILKGIPFFIKKIALYAKLTYNPLLHHNCKRLYNKYSKNINWMVLWGYGLGFFLLTIIWIFLFLFIVIPLFAIFATLCGLIMGDLNRTYFAFGMAEYEVTELEKKSMQKRIENSTGITALKSFASDKLTKFGEKTGLTEGISKLRKATENPFLKYKLPDVPDVPKISGLPSIPGLPSMKSLV